MPTYCYKVAETAEGCPVCRKGFEIMRPVSRPPLEQCWICKSPVVKLPATNVSTPTISSQISPSAAKTAGFSVWERRDEGVYERL